MATATRRSLALLPVSLFLLLPLLAAARAPDALTVVSAGPQGESATLAEANEIRVVFSEPMVTLGRIPPVVRAPFFKITPAVRGTFRWSGTTILIFTPDHVDRLPYATRYAVTIDTTATAISGRHLAAPYEFSFTTPTVHLKATNWYRKALRYDSPLLVGMRFNQPVKPADVTAHLSLTFKPHPWGRPTLQPEAEARLRTIDPQGLASFEEKVAATTRAAAASSPLTFTIAQTWNKVELPPSPELVVIEVTARVPTESWIDLAIDDKVPSPQGKATPASVQRFTIQMERTLFIERFRITDQVDPEAYNPIMFRGLLTPTAVRPVVSVSDITDPSHETTVATKPGPLRRSSDRQGIGGLTLEDLGYDPQPATRKYAVQIGPALRAEDGQSLGYPWIGIVENWHRSAFTSFGDGHGVWESSGGSQLPFHARNYRNVQQWIVPVKPGDLMPTLVNLQAGSFHDAPSGPGTLRTLAPKPDAVQSYGLNIASALDSQGRGMAWAAVEPGDRLPKTPSRNEPVHATVVQATNLGISVKDSPQNTLVFVTRLDNGDPVERAHVAIVDTANKTFWSGTTDRSGLALAPNTPLRDAHHPDRFTFIVTAEKDGDFAYVGNDWNEGIHWWDFDYRYSLSEANPILRGTVFSDRGVYRLGEEVHLKAILRQDTPHGIRLLAPSTPIDIVVRDSRSKVVDKRTVKVNDWSTVEWTMSVPAEGALGNYSIRASTQPPPSAPDATATAKTQAASDTSAASDDDGDGDGEVQSEEGDYEYDYGYTRAADLRRITGTFLVVAYRRPDFRVDVTLTGDAAIAGEPLKGVVTARYLFGAPMASRNVTWTFTRSPSYSVPREITERYSPDGFVFIGCCYGLERTEQLETQEVTLDVKGQKALDLGTKAGARIPFTYTLEGQVEDVSRQRIANRTSVTVHPAPWYIGVKDIPYFSEQPDGVKTAIVAVTPDGKPAAGVPVHVTLTQTQWHSVRRAEGNGFYGWEVTSEDIAAGAFDVTTAETPVPLAIALKSGGYFTLLAVGTDDAGHTASTKITFYALGEGYTAWMRYDHNRIDLVPERQTYKPGDQARIVIKSPWERATALVTTEREGIRSQRQFTLTSTQQAITVPITEADIPNVFVSVLLIKGRTKTEIDPNDTSDPGKPAFRLGYVELQVADDAKHLDVTVKANKDEYRPATAATVTVAVKDRQGRPAPSEVTLWAVDYGVLSLTGFRAPGVVDSVYLHKALQVATTDNRQRIVSRRVLTPKGADEGGGGGEDSGSGTLRKDFRVLAFWLGSVITDKDGHATTTVKLPESLTTYRIMAVSGDKLSRFGAGDSEIRINKPVLLRAAFPRFLAVGDKAFFGSVINSQLKQPGTATVTMRSLDPDVLEVERAQQTVEIAANGTAEVRFNAMGRTVGRARVQMTVKLNGESDGFEDVVPVELLVSPETVTAYGEARGGPPAKEALTVPAGVVKGFGGLHVELSSTAMVGLGEGARYLVEYPYGCAEQRGSRALALLLAADLGEAFALPGIEAKELRPVVQRTLKDLERYQCPDGGFSYWPGECWSRSPYLTSYLLHVFQVAQSLKYDVDKDMMDRAYKFLEVSLAREPDPNEGWRPSYTSWQAFAVKVLVESGHNEDSHLTRLYGYADRMPVFGLAHLLDALVAKGEQGARVEDLRRRLMNAILPEGGSAHVEELGDPYLRWYWSSNVRTTSIVLGSLVRDFGPEAPVRQMVRWLMTAREKGRWGNTQENAWAMESLVAYYRKFEAEVPDFTGVVAFGGDELSRDTFKGCSATATTREIPMKDLAAKAAPGATRDLTFTRDGSAGTLFYLARLRYASDALVQDSLDVGFSIERRYARLASADAQPDAPATTFKAGDLIKVTLSFTLTKERRFVAVTDPLPAGVEPVDSWFATTAADVKQRQQNDETDARTWRDWWERGGFDHIERHDDRVLLFATRLSEGHHEFSYIVRATTAGTYRTAPAQVEEMYEPEVFGRTPTALIEVKP